MARPGANGSVVIDVDYDDNEVKKGVKGTKKSLTDMAKVATTAIIGIGTALIGTAIATREFREDVKRLEVAFADVGHTAETANEVAGAFYGILGEYDVAVEASSHLAELTNDTKELEKWTNIASGVNAKFGDSLPLEGLTEAASVTSTLGK